MKEINLLPEELKPKTYAIKLSKNLRKAAIYGLVVFFIFLVVLGGASLALDFRNSTLLKTEMDLKNQVQTYEATEQRLILVKDRLGKIDTVLTAENTSSGIDSLELISNNLPPNVILSKADIETDHINVLFSTDTSQNISNLYSALEGMKFTQVSLLAFNYNTEVGYQVSMEIVK